MRDTTALTDTEQRCLTTLIGYFFGKNVATSSFVEIEHAFYKPRVNAVRFASLISGLPRQADFPMPLLKRTLDSLSRQMFLSSLQRSEETLYQLHEDFVEEAQEIYSASRKSSPILLKPETIIPAADRFVSLDHNSVNYQRAKDGLKELEDRIINSNELTANADERLAISREIKGLQSLLDEPVVRVASIWRVTAETGILSWLAQHGSDAVLNALAIEVVGRLLKLVGLS